MNSQYQQSGDVTAGSADLFATQAQVFELAAEREHLSSNKVSEIKTRLVQLMQKVEGISAFLPRITLLMKVTPYRKRCRLLMTICSRGLRLKASLVLTSMMASWPI